MTAAWIENPLERQMVIASVICTELGEKGTKTVIVGGSAVEFYTVANYLTMDLDIIATDADNIREVMVSLGFSNNGGTWHLPEAPQVIVEFPPGPLAGSWDRIQPVLMPDGSSVNVIGLEDIIIDRALAAAYWSDSPEWVRFMMVARYDEIDWDYLLKRADQEACRDIVDKSRVWAHEKRQKFENE